MKNFRDIEQLSSYLDGQLSPSDSARIESRLSSDPELASAYNDIRAARSILRKLPARKAPRNFTLTRQMVGLKPPLPRSYSFFRFSTALATILLMLTFAANLAAPRLTVQPILGMGGGCDPCMGGGDGTLEAPFAAAAVAVTEAPAATEAPAMEFSADIAVTATPGAQPTMLEDTARIVETPSSAPKEPVTESVPLNQPPVESEAAVSAAWQVVLAAIGLISAAIAFFINRNARKKWS